MAGDGVEINIKADVDNAVIYLKDIDGNSKRIQKSILKGIGSATKTAIKKDYRHHFAKKTGNLYKNITRKVNARGDAVFITSAARGNNKVLYGYALAQGTEIKPKVKEYMRIKIDDKWITSHGFKLPSEDWVQGPAESFISSPKYQEQLDKIMNKQLKRIEKKRGWKF